ncbi:MAG: hypothetical protein QG641_642 [Candidatus Poribacteria bacterium]|nr:hypothetical protein [Candidatus Poribacteria bacterium]
MNYYIISSRSAELRKNKVYEANASPLERSANSLQQKKWGSLQPLLQVEDRRECSGAYPQLFCRDIFCCSIGNGGVIMNQALLIVFGSITGTVVIPLIVIFTYLYFSHRAVTKKELRMLQNDISLIKADIEDIKEQIAEFIIKTN